MSNFYLLPSYIGLFGLMLIAAAAIIQAANVVYSFRRLETADKNLPEKLWEIAILGQLFLMAMLLAEVSHFAHCGFIRPSGYIAPRYLLFLLLGVVSFVFLGKNRQSRRADNRNIQPAPPENTVGIHNPLCGDKLREEISLTPPENAEGIFAPLKRGLRSRFDASIIVFVPLAAAVALPVAERLFGGTFPLAFFAAAIFLLLRGVYRWREYRQAAENSLSALSIKEAIDALDSGLLFFAPDGQILLQNRKIQDLMFALTGRLQANAAACCRALERGEVLGGCQKIDCGGALSYQLPDGRVWLFNEHTIKDGGQEWRLLAATDTTEEQQATEKLWRQNRELAERNENLRLMLENLAEICRTTEIINAKGRIHDDLGQRISLLLRALREGRIPDAALLAGLNDDLLPELFREAEGRSLQTMAAVFQSLGVKVSLDGELPPQPHLAQAFYEIAAEAVTNAVRHGYANEINVKNSRTDKEWQMAIDDNGLAPAAPPAEGGGLAGMRRKINELGGKFAYFCDEHFRIFLAVPIDA